MNEEKPRKPRATLWVCSALAVVLLYVLSAGPTHALCRKYRPDPFSSVHRWWRECYAPLGYIPKTTPIAHWLRKYIAWWDQVVGEPVY